MSKVSSASRRDQGGLNSRKAEGRAAYGARPVSSSGMKVTGREPPLFERLGEACGRRHLGPRAEAARAERGGRRRGVVDHGRPPSGRTRERGMHPRPLAGREDQDAQGAFLLGLHRGAHGHGFEP